MTAWSLRPNSGHLCRVTLALVSSALVKCLLLLHHSSILPLPHPAGHAAPLQAWIPRAQPDEPHAYLGCGVSLLGHPNYKKQQLGDFEM